MNPLESQISRAVIKAEIASAYLRGLEDAAKLCEARDTNDTHIAASLIRGKAATIRRQHEQHNYGECRCAHGESGT